MKWILFIAAVSMQNPAGMAMNLTLPSRADCKASAERLAAAFAETGDWRIVAMNCHPGNPPSRNRDR